VPIAPGFMWKAFHIGSLCKAIRISSLVATFCLRLGCLRALGYVRVSLPEEDPRNQEVAIEEFARRNGLELLKIFRDVGVSGSRRAFEREGFKQMYEVAKALDIKTIIVFDLTRLGRDLFDLIETYRALLEEGFTVLFVKHPELNAQPDNPLGEALRKAILVLLGVVAEMERAFISERTKAAMERARAEGRQLGRRPVEIPLELVKRYRRQGLPKTAIYKLLVSEGYLRYKEKGATRVLSYDRFVKRLKQMGL